MMDILPLTSASAIALLSMLPANSETDLAKLGLGGALAIVCLVSMWLGHKEKVALAESVKTLAAELGSTNSKLHVLTEKLEHSPCLLHGKR